MKIDLQSIDTTQFMVHEHVLNGELVYLVQPQHIGTKWLQDNKHFRSSLWDVNGELISAGFPKFTNWGENPENFPVPTSLKNTTIAEKVDGSLLIVSKWKGVYIIRTRGTVDASSLDNGFEIEIFKENILSILKDVDLQIGLTIVNKKDDTQPISWLFEWTSPHQKIVLNYGDIPQWHLVGIIEHKTYSLVNQITLDNISQCLKIPRPEMYLFPGIDELLANVDLWKGKEGVCVYSQNDQTIHKVKSAWYLALHHMKSELASFDKVIDVWINMNRPNYQEFYDNVTKQFDFELAEQVRGDISRICDGYKEVQLIVQAMRLFVSDNLLPMGDPKDKKARGQMAKKVIDSYGNTNRANFLFKLLDGKDLESDDIKKLLYQVLK